MQIPNKYVLINVYISTASQFVCEHILLHLDIGIVIKPNESAIEHNLDKVYINA